MTSYITITDAQTDPDAPLTSELAKQWRDNPIAIAEDEPNAPKIRRRFLVSGAAALTHTLLGLGDYSGVDFFIFANIQGAGSGDLNFSYSNDNGATFAVNSVIFNFLSGSAYIKGAFDFQTGTFRAIGFSSGSIIPRQNFLTIPGASLNINAIRFNTPGTGGHVVLLSPNGGT